MRSFIAFLSTLGVATLITAPPASAQLGYLRFGGHVTGGAYFQGTPAHVYFAQGSDLVEKPDVAFSPGSHTIARIEFDYKWCTAVATNVTFTIVAGQITPINPELSLVSCLIQVAPYTHEGGSGKIQLIVGNQVMFECVIAPSLTGGPPIFGPFDSCNRTLGYGTAFKLRIIPHDAHTLINAPGCAPETEGTSTILCDDEKADTISQGDHAFGFEGLDIPEPPAPSSDVSIARLSTSIAGLGLISTFRVTNHGPDAAAVSVAVTAESGAVYLGHIDAGPCVYYLCRQLLPASASLDFTIRIAPYFGLDGGGNIMLPAADFGCTRASVSVTIYETEDPDPTNNIAPCIGTDVTIAVAPGTSAPPNATVATGSDNVPMLQFILDPPSPITLDNITVTASGTGNEQVDVTAVKLYVDTNGNGVVDGGESAIASGTSRRTMEPWCSTCHQTTR